MTDKSFSSAQTMIITKLNDFERSSIRMKAPDKTRIPSLAAYPAAGAFFRMLHIIFLII